MSNAFNGIWIHIDLGKSKVCARAALGSRIYQYKHGDTVEWIDNIVLDNPGISFSPDPQKHKGIFRLIEKDLFEEEWVQKELPAAKAWWETEREKNRRSANEGND